MRDAYNRITLMDGHARLWSSWRSRSRYDDADSPQALRSTVYGKALTQGTDNSFYVGTDRTANGRNWQIMAATETVSTELQSLTGSVRSRAHFTRGYVQPTAECTRGVVLPTSSYRPQPNGSFSNLVSARVFQEETPKGMNASAAEVYFWWVSARCCGRC